MRRAGFRSVEAPRFHPLCVVWVSEEPVFPVVRVFLSRPGAPALTLARGAFPDGEVRTSLEMDRFAAELAAFLEGADTPLDTRLLRMEECTSFQRRVLSFLAGIPRGHTATYGGIAAALGTGPRAVGTALARNPFPLVLPCHRVIRVGGAPGNYQGGTAMKRALLTMEGITPGKGVDHAG